MRKLLSSLRRAVNDYRMIEHGDRIVVGLSGGKDSLSLLAAMRNYQLFSPEKFELYAVTVDLGFENADFTAIRQYCKNLGVEYKIIPTNIYEIVFIERKEKNPCSLCSKMRRGALNTAIKEMGANKLALGHHADDVLETFLLSLCYEGRLSTFAPLSYMDRSDVTLIRPFIYVDEKDLKSFSRNLPVAFNPCPADHETQREYMKNLVKAIQKDIPFARDRMLSALQHPERNNLWDVPDKLKTPKRGS